MLWRLYSLYNCLWCVMCTLNYESWSQNLVVVLISDTCVQSREKVIDGGSQFFVVKLSCRMKVFDHVDISTKQESINELLRRKILQQGNEVRKNKLYLLKKVVLYIGLSFHKRQQTDVQKKVHVLFTVKITVHLHIIQRNSYLCVP